MANTTGRTTISATTADAVCWGPQCASWGPQSPSNFGGVKYAYPDQQRLLARVSATVLLAIGVAGVLLNGFLVWITVRNKELRTSAGCLLSLVAVCDAVCSAAPLVSVYFAWLAADFWAKQTTCFYALLPVVFLFSAMQVLLLELGLDRLLAVAFPIWHMTLSLRRYLVVLIAVAVFVAGYVVVSGLVSLSGGGRIMLPRCELACNFVGPYGRTVGAIFAAILGATIACYVAIFLVMRYRYGKEGGGGAAASTPQRQLFRSLAVLFGVYVGCWLLSTLIKYNQQNFLPPNFVSNALSSLAGAVIAITQTLNTPVLYATSEGYREAMRAEWKRLFSSHSANGAGTTAVAAVALFKIIRRPHPPLPASHTHPHQSQRQATGGGGAMVNSSSGSVCTLQR